MNFVFFTFILLFPFINIAALIDNSKAYPQDTITQIEDNTIILSCIVLWNEFINEKQSQILMHISYMNLPSMDFLSKIKVVFIKNCKDKLQFQDTSKVIKHLEKQKNKIDIKDQQYRTIFDIDLNDLYFDKYNMTNEDHNLLRKIYIFEENIKNHADSKKRIMERLDEHYHKITENEYQIFGISGQNIFKSAYIFSLCIIVTLFLIALFSGIAPKSTKLDNSEDSDDDRAIPKKGKDKPGFD